MASDRTSQTGEATAGFVQRPTIPPRSRRVISHSPLEIAAEYRAIVRRPEVTRRRYPRNLYLTFSHINSATMTLPSMPLGCGLVVM